jgi:hypothetical protein
LAAQEALTRYEEKGNLVGSLRATKLLHLGDTPSQPISH